MARPPTITTASTTANTRSSRASSRRTASQGLRAGVAMASGPHYSAALPRPPAATCAGGDVGIGGGSAEGRLARRPVGGALVGPADAKDRGFVEGPPHDLEGEREPGAGEAAG